MNIGISLLFFVGTYLLLENTLDFERSGKFAPIFWAILVALAIYLI